MRRPTATAYSLTHSVAGNSSPRIKNTSQLAVWKETRRYWNPTTLPMLHRLIYRKFGEEVPLLSDGASVSSYRSRIHRVAVDMKFPIHIHIHIHRFCVDIHSGVARNFSQGVRNSICLQSSTYVLHCFCRERNLWQPNPSSLAALPQWKLNRSFGDASWWTYDDGSTLR